MTTIGVLGRAWRADVTAWGAIDPWHGTHRLDWWIAADDRWHVPENEPTLRQRRLDGAPVVETRVKVPTGDVVQRVYAVADEGGLTIVEFENASTLPVAIALSHPDVLTVRPPADVPIQGIELPQGAIVLPLGHQSTLQVAVAHDGRRGGVLPGELPTALQVARGWLVQMERASRLVLPDDSWTERVVAARCDLALAGLDAPEDDPVAFLLGAHELSRLGAPVDDWIPMVIDAAETIARSSARAGGPTWDEDRALVATVALLAAAHESRGMADVRALRVRLGDRRSAALTPPDGVRVVAWVEDQLARPRADGSCALLPAAFPASWLGVNLECYRLPAGDGADLSYALRWHGERPALLWELHGAPSMRLTGGAADPAWSTTDPQGEALLAAP
ncbi:MAG: hypothetical protein AB7Q42_01850 [Acidimicrobiia bacterium]